MIKTIFILLISIPGWLAQYVGTDHEKFMDSYPDNLIEGEYHTEYRHIIDTLAIGSYDTITTYIHNPMAIDRLYYNFEGVIYTINVDAIGIISSIECEECQ